MIFLNLTMYNNIRKCRWPVDGYWMCRLMQALPFLFVTNIHIGKNIKNCLKNKIINCKTKFPVKNVVFWNGIFCSMIPYIEISITNELFNISFETFSCQNKHKLTGKTNYIKSSKKKQKECRVRHSQNIKYIKRYN